MPGRHLSGTVAWLFLLLPLSAQAGPVSNCLQPGPAPVQPPQLTAQQPAPHVRPDTLAAARQLTDDGNAAFDRGDLATAESDHRAALLIREKLAPHSLPVAESLDALGNVVLDRGDLANAQVDLERALRIRTRLAPGSRDLARSLISLGNLARRRGEIAHQQDYFERAQQVGAALTPIDQANILDGLGNACSQRACAQKTQDYFDRALQLRQQYQPDSLGLADTLSFRGRFASLQGDLQDGEQDFTRALELRRQLAPASLAVATSLTDLGVTARARGNLAEAERCLRAGLEIRQHIVPHGLAVADSLHNLGILFWLREDLTTARTYLEQTLRIRRKLIPSSPALAQSLIWQGLLSVRSGELAAAEAYFGQALELLRNNYSPDSVVVASVLMNLGNVARIRGELAESEDYYRRALAMQIKQAPDSPAEANGLQALAGLVRQHGKLPEAESDYRQALSILDQKAPDSSAHGAALFGLASLMRQEHRWDEADHAYAQAIDVVERQTTTLGGTPEDRSVFRARFENSYKDYADFLIAQKQPDMALRVLERERAWALLEMLDRARVSPGGGRDSELEHQKRSLEAEISAKSSYRIALLDGGGSDGQLSELDRQLAQLQDQYRETQERIELQDPAYTALTHPTTLTAQQVQQLLDDDTVLLEYSLGQYASYVWAVTRTSLVAYRLPVRGVIEKAVAEFRGELTARGLQAQETDTQRRKRLSLADTRYSAAARELSRLVLGPVAGLLTHPRMVLVSDGALQYVPFAALPAPPGPAAAGDPPTDQDVPLVMEHEITNLPSASVLAELRQKALARTPPPKSVAVLADPVFDVNDDRITHPDTADVLSELATDAAESMSPKAPRGLRGTTPATTPREGPPDILLDRLLWTRVEAAQIMKVTPAGTGLLAQDFAANLTTALSPSLAQYRIVHFATHAVSDSDHPERSGLVLSLFDRRGQPQNGFLSLQQIYGLNLPADLVVLSACETALGREIGGEGLVGLVRGFMYAGATRVIASLWSVDDEVTANLMAHFYHNLELEGLSPAAALRAAQVAVRKEPKWRAPYYWAGFQLQGEWR
jgi:CHAT domain-containing protein/Tfp pilus assembly protein PilF